MKTVPGPKAEQGKETLSVGMSLKARMFVCWGQGGMKIVFSSRQ